MRTGRSATVIVALILFSNLLLACGPKGPKADVDINATIVDIYLDREGLRVTDIIGGRKYELLVPSTTEITYNEQVTTLDQLKHGYQIHLWANEVSGKPFKYEAVKIQVIDLGGAAPPRR